MNTNTKTDISFDRLKEVLIALKGENISVVVDSEQSPAFFTFEQSPPFFTFNAYIKPDSDGTLGEFENLSEFLVNDHPLLKTLQINYRPNAASYKEMQEQLNFLSETFPNQIYQSFDKYLQDNDDDVKVNPMVMKPMFFNCRVVGTIYDVLTVCAIQGRDVVVLEPQNKILKKYIAFRNEHDVKLVKMANAAVKSFFQNGKEVVIEHNPIKDLIRNRKELLTGRTNQFVVKVMDTETKKALPVRYFSDIGSVMHYCASMSEDAPVLYPATFTDDETSGFVITFRDVPEAITQADTMEEAMEMAKDVLQSALEIYEETNRPFPEPSAYRSGDVMVQLK